MFVLYLPGLVCPMMRFSQRDARERNSSAYQESSSSSKVYLEPILRVAGSGLLAYMYAGTGRVLTL